MIPGRPADHRNSTPGSATTILGLTVIMRPLAGWTLRSVILLPTATSPDASRNSGFHSGYRPRSVRTAQTVIGGAPISVPADMIFIGWLLSRPLLVDAGPRPGQADF